MSQSQINDFVNLLNSGSPYQFINFMNNLQNENPIIADLMNRSMTPHFRNMIGNIQRIAEQLHNNPSKNFLLNVFRNVDDEARRFYDQFLEPNVKYFKNKILSLDNADDYEVLLTRWSRLNADWKEESWDYITEQTREKLNHIFMREGALPPLPPANEPEPTIQPRPRTPRNIIQPTQPQPLMEEKSNE